MTNELDCRGLECPAPVLHVRDALAKEASNDISVLVDNEAARQNVSRFLEHQSYQVQSDGEGELFRVVGRRGGDASHSYGISTSGCRAIGCRVEEDHGADYRRVFGAWR